MKNYTIFDKLAIPAEYFAEVNDILNDIKGRFRMTDDDIMKYSELFESEHEKYIENYPKSIRDNFFADLILKRNNGIRAARDYIEAYYKD